MWTVLSDSLPGESVMSSRCDLSKHGGEGEKSAQVQLVWLGAGLQRPCHCEHGGFIPLFSLGNLYRPKQMFPADSSFHGHWTSRVERCPLLLSSWGVLAPGEWLRVRGLQSSECFIFQGHSSTEGLAWEKECSSCQESMSQLTPMLMNLAAREPQSPSPVTGVIDNLFSYFNSKCNL